MRPGVKEDEFVLRRHEFGGRPGPEVAARLEADPIYRALYQAHKAKAVKAVLVAEEARRASRSNSRA